MKRTRVESDSSTLGYWDSFYAARRSADVPTEPSAFARWVDGRLAGPQSVAELGFGNARDTFWLAGRGHTMIAFDGASSAVEHAVTRAEGTNQPSFACLDLTDDAAVREAAAAAGDVGVVYARFLLHSLPDPGRANVFAFAASALRAGGELYLEFRTGKDAHAEHLFGDDHFRVYLDADDVAAEIEAVGGTIDHLEQGHGLAVYKSEDPHVARIVASW